MDLTLERRKFQFDGVFSDLYDDQGKHIAVTLEHAYLTENGYEAKIPCGTFKCVRGLHKLHGMLTPFATFEITGVAGHTNLLFHWGNYQEDSEGCILLGHSIVPNPDTRHPDSEMITRSKETFLNFMKLQEGINEFTLTVK